MSWPHILQSLTIETLILEETFTIIVRAFTTAGRLLAISLSSWLPKITWCFLNKNNPFNGDHLWRNNIKGFNGYYVFTFWNQKITSGKGRRARKNCNQNITSVKGRRRRTVGQIPQKCKETSNLMWLPLI